MTNINEVNTGNTPKSVQPDRRTERAGKDEKQAADEARRERAADEARREWAADEIERLRIAREAVLQELRDAEYDADRYEALRREREAMDEKIRELGGSVVDVEA